MYCPCLDELHCRMAAAPEERSAVSKRNPWHRENQIATAT